MLAIKQFLEKDDVKKKFEEVLGDRAWSYLTSVLSVINSNDMLKEADPQTVYLSALTSATLNLPINQNLGFAYIVPYKNNKTGKTAAQFQMGYKWFIQLAQRSWLFKTISATPVYEGQLIEENPLIWYEFDWKAKTSDTVIWYAWYFKLLNGFEKTLYMTVDELKKHGTKFSQSFKKGFGLWKDDFDSMAIKTVIKLLLSKFAPLSVEMQKAVITDQGVLNWEDENDIEYPDNEWEVIEWETSLTPALVEHWVNGLNECKTLEELEEYKKQNKPTDPAILDLFTKRKDELNNTK